MTLDKSVLRIDIFKYAFDEKLKHNLSDYLISTLSNMLGLHYASDHKLQTVEKNIQKYANNLADKLLNFLGDEVIIEETFDVAMHLFAVALSPSMPNREEPPNLNTNKSATIDMVANLCFPEGDISQEEYKNLEIAMGDILSSKEAGPILALIEKKPGILKSLLQKKSSSKDILSNLSIAASSISKKNNISSDFAQFAGIAAMTIIGAAANVAVATYIDAVAAVAIIPTTIAAVKYGTQIGEAFGNKLAAFDGEFKKHSANLKDMVQKFVPTLKKPNLGKAAEQEKKNEIDKSNKILNEVKHEIENHLSTKQNIENTVDIQKIKKQEKSIGKNAF